MELKKGHYYYFYYSKSPSECYRAVVKLDRIHSKNQNTDYFGHTILLIEDTIGWTTGDLYLKKESFVHEVTKETRPELFL